jgi:GDP-L-fucose synthase
MIDGAAFDITGKRIWVCGHGGMVGSALVRRLASEECALLLAGRALDLTRQFDVLDWLCQNRPDAIIVAAAKVGGIQANAAYPVAFLADNLAIAHNVICGAAQCGVPRLIFLAPSCIYPREAEQPIREDALLTGRLEPTNQWYAVAKIAGLKLTEAFRAERNLDYFTAIPANLYGPGDNFDPQIGPVIPALMRRMHEARLTRRPAISIRGSGAPTRAFMHVDDCADAIVHLLKTYRDGVPINIGPGDEISIRALAEGVAEVAGYAGRLEFDTSRPDGMARKALDGTRLAATGWRGGRPLRDGLAETYRHFLDHIEQGDPYTNNVIIMMAHHG